MSGYLEGLDPFTQLYLTVLANYGIIALGIIIFGIGWLSYHKLVKGRLL